MHTEPDKNVVLALWKSFNFQPQSGGKYVKTFTLKFKRALCCGYTSPTLFNKTYLYVCFITKHIKKGKKLQRKLIPC